ncbi:MAG: hypothetical protein FJY98_04355 [Candidatus Liptonbacteria bacterium]|nr:hypothetical protein [Candidatus Liptonbacteria bacterium]
MTSTTPWAADEHLGAPPPRSSGRFKLFGILAFLFLAGVGIFSYFLFRQPAGVSVSVEFETPPQPLLGEPFPLSLSLANQSDGVLYGAKFSIILPEDVLFVGEYSRERVHDEALGSLGPGSVTQRTVNVVVVGQPQAVKRVRAKFVYSTSPEGRVQFEKEAAAEIRVGAAALELSLEAPKQVVNGAPFTATVKYKNASKQEFKNVRVAFRYPSLFSLTKASLESATRTNDSWSLGNLPAGTQGEITFDGVVVGAEGSFFTLNAAVTADYLGESRELAVQTASLAIATSPLSVAIGVSGVQNNAANPGEVLQYSLTLKNNSSVVFRGITLNARLIGAMFNYSTLRAQASFNSLTNTLTWLTANTPELQSLNPGESKTLTFDIALKGTYPISRVSDKNYTLKVEARAESPTVLPDTAVDTTVAVGSFETKVAGKIALHAKALWKDAAWGIVNSGPFPPRVNQPTQYTIHWIITNYATDASGVRVEAYLQSGAKFLGKAKSTGATLPQYDAATGKVVWDIPSVAATRGVVGAPIEGVFQIEVIPSSNHLGGYVPILSESRLQAKDIFTGMALESTAGVLQTDLLEDPTVTVQDRRVQQ